MPSEGSRRGRRDNGLDAAAFVPLLDVDPRVGEHLLDVLASAGVPAYLEPSADIEPYTRAVALPSPPTDRLWVDREQRAAAREIVDAETPHGPRPRPAARDDEPSHGLTDLDEERAWREIVAGWNAPAVDPPAAPTPPDAGAATAAGMSPVRPWPAEEDDQPVCDGDSDAAGPGGGRPVPTAADLDRAAEERAAEEMAAEERAAEEGAAAGGDELHIAERPTLDEGHYQPPPPRPVPRPSRPAVLGGLVIVLGILLMAAPGLVGLDHGTGLTFGVLCVLGGGAILVLRLRETRSDDGPDDGAVV